MSKAKTSLSAARLLLEHGYTDEACSCAYYAMFEAARAAIQAVDAPTEGRGARSHSGVIGAFARSVVAQGLISRETARTLAQAQHLRLIATTAATRWT
jgi:uncharacterized protein (UPF0332 family)